MSSQCIHITPSLPPGSRLGEPAPVDPFTPGSLPFAPGCGYHGPSFDPGLRLRIGAPRARCRPRAPSTCGLPGSGSRCSSSERTSCELRALRAGRRARGPGLGGKGRVLRLGARSLGPGARAWGSGLGPVLGAPGSGFGVVLRLGAQAWGQVLGARGSGLGPVTQARGSGLGQGPRATGCARRGLRSARASVGRTPPAHNFPNLVKTSLHS